MRQFPLANPRVRWVGAPLAVVVADDRYLAEDAAELVQMELEPLPTVGTMEESRAPGAPRLYDDWPDNVVVDVPAQSAAVDEAFARLRVVSGSYVQQRHAAVPMEPRGVVASFEAQPHRQPRDQVLLRVDLRLGAEAAADVPAAAAPTTASRA